MAIRRVGERPVGGKAHRAVGPLGHRGDRPARIFKVVRTGPVGAGNGVKGNGRVFGGRDAVGHNVPHRRHRYRHRVRIRQRPVRGGYRQVNAPGPGVKIRRGGIDDGRQGGVDLGLGPGDGHRARAVAGDGGAAPCRHRQNAAARGQAQGRGQVGAVSIPHRQAADGQTGVFRSALRPGHRVHRHVVHRGDVHRHRGRLGDAAGSDRVGEAVRTVVVTIRRIGEGAVGGKAHRAVRPPG